MKVIKGNKGTWTREEHEAFLRGHELFGKNWDAIVSLVPTRSALQIRTHAQKYLRKIDSGLSFPCKVCIKSTPIYG
ncbi:unnamed protein product [Sphacelaria rigidula]